MTLIKYIGYMHIVQYTLTGISTAFISFDTEGILDCNLLMIDIYRYFGLLRLNKIDNSLLCMKGRFEICIVQENQCKILPTECHQG